MYASIYVCGSIYLYTHTHTHTHIHTSHTHTLSLVYTYVYMYTNTHTHTHAHTHTRTVCMYVCIYIYIYSGFSRLWTRLQCPPKTPGAQPRRVLSALLRTLMGRRPLAVGARGGGGSNFLLGSLGSVKLRHRSWALRHSCGGRRGHYIQRGCLRLRRICHEHWAKRLSGAKAFCGWRRGLL